MTFYSRARDILRGFDAQCDSFLVELFYSKSNVDIVQRQIVLSVYQQRDCKIPFQNEDDLLVVMTGVLKAFGRFIEAPNSPDCYRKQIKILNQAVVDGILPDLLASVDLQLSYEQQFVDKEGNHQHRDLLPPPISTQTRKGDIPSVTAVWSSG